MRSTLILGVSAVFMSVGLLATFSNDSVAGKAMGQVEVTTAPTTSESPQTTPELIAETPMVEETTSTTPTPEKSVEASAPTPVPTQITVPQEDEAGWDCRVSGNRVCGVPDEAGTIFLVCHDINGMPVRIVSDARNCK